MVEGEREMVRKPEENTPEGKHEERFTSLQPTYEDSVPPDTSWGADEWDDED